MINDITYIMWCFEFKRNWNSGPDVLTTYVAVAILDVWLYDIVCVEMKGSELLPEIVRQLPTNGCYSWELENLSLNK